MIDWSYMARLTTLGERNRTCGNGETADARCSEAMASHQTLTVAFLVSGLSVQSWWLLTCSKIRAECNATKAAKICRSILAPGCRNFGGDKYLVVMAFSSLLMRLRLSVHIVVGQ